MKKVIYLTTDTDGLVKHAVLSEETLKYFPKLLRLSYWADGGLEDVFVYHDMNIPTTITDINGIRTEYIKEFGKPHEEVASKLEELFADHPDIVTNNVKFHKAVLESFMFRLDKKLPGAIWTDIQEEYRDICQLESRKAGSYKTPKLKEVEYYLKDKGVNIAGKHQLDIVKAAYENRAELRERVERENEYSGY